VKTELCKIVSKQHLNIDFVTQLRECIKFKEFRLQILTYCSVFMIGEAVVVVIVGLVIISLSFRNRESV
jgi:hypothetical protein